jgi:histidinol phosphatase-like enzyme (inositol monophosphatase family)
MELPILDSLLEFATDAAREAGTNALRYFQKQVEVEQKADASPVTIADREGELLLRARIEEKFPGHGILGEEFGVLRPQAEWRWVLDPIDGTRTFVRGVPLWGVLVGLQQSGEPVLGVVHFPALGETLCARRGGGTWCNGVRAHVSSVAKLEDATLLLTDLQAIADAGKQAGCERLRSRAGFERTWGDCYGHALVATGRAEIMLDPVMNEWDCCALMPVVEEAGGHFTDWKGVRTVRGGSAVSTNSLLHPEVIKLL